MTRRVVAAIAAIILAVVGAVSIATYVGAADERAVSKFAPVEVLTVTAPVSDGAQAESLTDTVALTAIPQSAVAPGALSNLDDVAGLVTVGELVPGEQLVRHRFADAEVAAARSGVEVPPGLHQVTIQLDPVRVLGGHLAEGDSVGVFTSLAGASGGESDTPAAAPGSTHLVLQKVLVTRVQGALSPSSTGTETVATSDGSETATQPPEAVPTAQILVTLALTASDAEKLVYSAEFERIWLSIEDAEASADGTRAVSRESIFQ